MNMKNSRKGADHKRAGDEREFNDYSAVVCEQNKNQILSIILPILSTANHVLEIASGTGQHAIYFAKKMPHLTWHTSEHLSYIDCLNTWVTEAKVNNVIRPIVLDVSVSKWPSIDIDAVFTANSFHVMQRKDIVSFMKGAGDLLKQHGNLIIYGPFKYNGLFTSTKAKRLDKWLKGRDAYSGIKHFEEINLYANDNGFRLVTDYHMPENNRILHYIKL